MLSLIESVSEGFPSYSSISVHQIFRNCRGFNDLEVQTYDLSSLTTLLVKISVL